MDPSETTRQPPRGMPIKTIAITAIVIVAVLAVIWVSRFPPDVYDWRARGSPNLHEPLITVGVFGHIILREGDCMPPTTPAGCRLSFVSRAMHIHQPAHLGDMDPNAPIYLQNETPLVAVGHSGFDGFYEVALPPGMYSVFVEDLGRKYCNSFSGTGLVCPLEVGAGPVRLDLWINHATD